PSPSPLSFRTRSGARPALPPSPTRRSSDLTASALRYAGGLAEWNDVNMCVEQATINLGNTVIMRECPTTIAGFISAYITDRVPTDRKSTRLNSSHVKISYAVFCLKKKTTLP